jgi:hypothetical protein
MVPKHLKAPAEIFTRYSPAVHRTERLPCLCEKEKPRRQPVIIIPSEATAITFTVVALSASIVLTINGRFNLIRRWGVIIIPE